MPPLNRRNFEDFSTAAFKKRLLKCARVLPVNRVCSTRVWSLVAPLLVWMGFTPLCVSHFKPWNWGWFSDFQSLVLCLLWIDGILKCARVLPVNRVCSTRIWSPMSPLLLWLGFTQLCVSPFKLWLGFTPLCGWAALHCDMSPLLVARRCCTKGVGTISPSSLPTAVYFSYWYLLVLFFAHRSLLYLLVPFTTHLCQQQLLHYFSLLWNQFESSIIFNHPYLSILVLADPWLELLNRTYFSTLPTRVKLFHFLTTLLLFARAQFNWNRFQYSTFADQSWP